MSPYENYNQAIIRYSEAGEIVTVVFQVVRQPDRFEIRSRSRINISPAALVGDPRYLVCLFGRNQFERVTRAQYLIDRKLPLCFAVGDR